MAKGVGAFESPDLGAPSRYLKHILLRSTVESKYPEGKMDINLL